MPEVTRDTGLPTVYYVAVEAYGDLKIDLAAEVNRSQCMDVTS